MREYREKQRKRLRKYTHKLMRERQQVEMQVSEIIDDKPGSNTLQNTRD